jgi:hypothetical protein
MAGQQSHGLWPWFFTVLPGLQGAIDTVKFSALFFLNHNQNYILPLIPARSLSPAFSPEFDVETVFIDEPFN